MLQIYKFGQLVATVASLVHLYQKMNKKNNHQLIIPKQQVSIDKLRTPQFNRIC